MEHFVYYFLYLLGIMRDIQNYIGTCPAAIRANHRGIDGVWNSSLIRIDPVHRASALTISEIPLQRHPQSSKQEHIQLLVDVQSKMIFHPRYVYSWFMNNYTTLISHNHSAQLNTLLSIAKRVTEISVEDYTNVKTPYKTECTNLLYQIFNV